MIVLFCGSREWEQWTTAPHFADKFIELVDKELESLQHNEIILHGGASGTDTIINDIALSKGMKARIRVERPNYRMYPGNIAPLKRDEKMVKMAEYVVAFWNGLSRGTKYTVNFALDLKKPVRLHKILYNNFSVVDPLEEKL